IEPEPEYVEPEPLVLEAIEEEELEPLPQMEPEVKEGSSAEEEKPVIQEEKRPEPEALILEAVEDDGPGPLYQDEPKQVIETIEEEEPELVIQKVKADHESPVLETVEEEELEPLPQIEPEVREDSRVAEEKPVIQEEKAGEPLIQREEPLALVTEPNTRESKEEETKPRDEKKVESPKETIYDYIEEESIEPEPEQKTTALTDSADEYGVTQLMRAAMSGNDWQVRTLIEGGADVNARDVDEWTALMYASRYQQNVQIVRTLIESGAYVRVRNKYNVTPLLMAAEYSQNPEILSVLLEDRSASEEEVFKAFILTVSSGQVSPQITKSKIRIFLDKGIAINRIWKGKTALMYACQYATDTEIIQLLLDQGAKTSIRDSSGKTAFDYAKENRTLDHNDTYWSLNGGQ
ncbi:MAG: ankyrin repeat domain-containing protein, partial [Treponema sp.]|nr:ankyrin repeat domain-containing protein [Treponema sp.]